MTYVCRLYGFCMSCSRTIYAGLPVALINGGAGDLGLENAIVVATCECLGHLTAELEELHLVVSRTVSLLL
jgi:hypothetical protein